MSTARTPVHRSKAVRAWLEANTDRIELHLMPGYSPELNPDVLLNADLNRHVNASASTTSTDSPARPDASCTAANANHTSSAATSTAHTSATPPCRQPNTFGSMQPNGPYLMVGWSFGGVVAQEMAVALENLGEEVPVLILLDAPPAERGNGETADELPEDLLSLIEQSIRSAAGGIPDDLSEDSEIVSDVFTRYGSVR